MDRGWYFCEVILRLTAKKWHSVQLLHLPNISRKRTRSIWVYIPTHHLLHWLNWLYTHVAGNVLQHSPSHSFSSDCIFPFTLNCLLHWVGSSLTTLLHACMQQLVLAWCMAVPFSLEWSSTFKVDGRLQKNCDLLICWQNNFVLTTLIWPKGTQQPQWRFMQSAECLTAFYSRITATFKQKIVHWSESIFSARGWQDLLYSDDYLL